MIVVIAGLDPTAPNYLEALEESDPANLAESSSSGEERPLAARAARLCSSEELAATPALIAPPGM